VRTKKLIKWSHIGIGLCILLYIGYGIVSFLTSGLFDSSSKQELIDNYKKNEKQILELKSFFNSIVPNGYTVYIEFNGKKNIDLFVYEIGKKTSQFGNFGLFQQWNINPYNYKEQPNQDTSEYSPQTNSLKLVKKRLNWDDDTFRTIKKKLDVANCISVSSGEPTEVGFARSGMGKYSYAIFSNPIPDALKQQYNDSCMYILYNQRIALQYGGGAIGAQCFPDK
jgi:hypothetical protein